jgi:hypothetical protein
MNGIIFAGCSFTWGQGLYYYSDLKHIPTFQEWVKDYSLMTNAPINFKNTIRFPRLVANHFSTYEICRETNGGSDEMSFKFIETLFDKDRGEESSTRHYSFLTTQYYNYDEIEYIVFQSSQPQRCSYKIIYMDEEYKVYVNDNSTNRTRVSKTYATGMEYDLNEKESLELIYKWLTENDLSIDDLYELHMKNQVSIMKEKFKFYETQNIKIKLLLWPNDLLSYILKDEYLKSKLIPLYYDNKKFNTIGEMFFHDWSLLIEHDEVGFGGMVPEIAKGDRHPSKKLHEILADNIIKSIEMDSHKKPLI